MINYLNLTSGLEWAKSIKDYKLVRIQSSHFESSKLWSVIADLDYQFLIDAAFNGVILHDCGSRSGDVSRAQWQGIPWISWVYAKANRGQLPVVITRGTNVENHFDNFYKFGESDRLRKKAKAKLRYVAKLTGSQNLNIEENAILSTLDGQTEELAKLGGFRKCLEL